MGSSHHTPIDFKALKQRVATPQSSLSRIIDQLEAVKLVRKTRHLDNTLTVTANPDAIYPATRFLVNAHTKMVQMLTAAVK